MELKNEHTLLEQSRPAKQAPKKRFRIVKLEERIAPRRDKCKSCGAGGSSPYPVVSVF